MFGRLGHGYELLRLAHAVMQDAAQSELVASLVSKHEQKQKLTRWKLNFAVVMNAVQICAAQM